MRLQYLLSTTSLKRILSLVLVLVMCLSFASCNKEEKILDGGNSVGGYSFSYPESWRVIKDGTSTQITTADVGGALPYATIRLTVFENTDKLSAMDYWIGGVDGFSRIYESYKSNPSKRGAFELEGVNSAYSAVVEVSLKGETKLDGQPDGPDKAVDYVIHQLVFEGNGRICVASFMSTVSNYDTYSYVMDVLKDSFAFTTAEDAEIKDKGAAEFTVPTPEGWTVESAEAYYRLSHGKATVIASVFAMSENYRAKEYWENSYKASVSQSLVDFEEGEIKDEEVYLDGVTAVDVSYTGKSVSGNKYNFRQVICVYYGQVFIVTLTADDADYKEAEKGFEAIVSGFKFK